MKHYTMYKIEIFLGTRDVDCVIYLLSQKMRI